MVWVMMKQTLVINVEVDVGSSSLGKTLRRSFREKPCAFVLKLKILAKLKENTRKIEGKYWQIWWLIQVVLSKCIKFSHHFPIFSPWNYMNILHLGGTHRYQIFRETLKIQSQVARHPEIVSISLGGQLDDDDDASTGKESARLTAS